MRSNPLPHQHTSPSSSLKNIINTLNLQRRTLLIRPRANRPRHPLRLLPTHVVPVGGVGRGRAEIEFAADEDDGDLRAAD